MSAKAILKELGVDEENLLLLVKEACILEGDALPRGELGAYIVIPEANPE
jgi:hypothetical protein